MSNRLLKNSGCIYIATALPLLISIGCTTTEISSHNGISTEDHTIEHANAKNNNQTKHESIKPTQKKWLAGDHHIHSKYSVKWDKTTSPPNPILYGDANYSTAINAQMAAHHGLSWMVTTDHGGPNHSKINMEQAYPELVASRQAVPNIIQFYGMELDTPGARHSSLIIPHSHSEAEQLFDIEKRFARNEVYPPDESRDTEQRMLDALNHMKSHEKKPIVIVNHPGRTATDLGQYTKVTPRELRDWNDTAPEIAIGMEGAPGHQAGTLHANGSLNPEGIRGGYNAFPTMGGFDQMTAKLGGFWDSMLGEGRKWWITANSDSHAHYTEGRTDFWPGQYSKTYVYSEKNYDDLLHNLRHGHVFVTTGDLVEELFVSVSTPSQAYAASIGDTLEVHEGDTVQINIRFLDPNKLNSNGDNPIVNRLDLIVGEVTSPALDKTIDTNETTRVVKRFDASSWQKDGVYTKASFVIKDVKKGFYVRVRGTNGNELEPLADPLGEDPWSDLWFYSNPIFVAVH